MRREIKERFCWWIPDQGYELAYIPMSEREADANVGLTEVGEGWGLSVQQPNEFSEFMSYFGISTVNSPAPLSGDSDFRFDPGLIFLRPARSGACQQSSLTPEQVANALRRPNQPSIQKRLLVQARDWQIKEYDNLDITGSRYYPLLRHEALYYTLANADPTVFGFMAFANQYGCLNMNMSLYGWSFVVEAFKRLVTLWKLCREGKKQELGRLLRVEEPNTRNPNYVLQFGNLFLQVHNAQQGSPELTKQSQQSTPYQPSTFGSAAGLLHRKATCNWDEFLWAHYFIIWDLNRMLNGETQWLTTFRPETKGDSSLTREMVPTTLLGAIAMQFEEVVAGKKEFRFCRRCGEPFDVGGGDNKKSGRRTKIYCSEEHRVADNQDRTKAKRASR